MKVQPTKVILINSANCQYAEFDLSDSLHLVARNNKGKTSIINTLQFLYIDKFKEMNLGYSLDESWKHYFPAYGSYVLFEINTLTGKKVFGLSATGLSSPPERFLVDEAYRLEDYIEKKDGQFIPRKPEKMFLEVNNKLTKRKIEAKEHRDILHAYDRKKNPRGLGLIGSTRSYPLFKRLFRQLLQLKDISIKELKKQIEQVNHSALGKDQQINIQRDYNQPYMEIQNKRAELQRLHTHKPTIEDLLEKADKQKQLQGRLVSYYIKSDPLFVKEEKEIDAKISIHQDLVKRKKQQLPDLATKKKEEDEVKGGLNKKLGVLEERINSYEALEKKCLEVVLPIEQEKLKNLKQEEKRLQKQLYTVEDSDINKLNQELIFRNSDLEEKQGILNRISDTLFAQLKQLLNDDELKLLYKLTNADIWRLFNKEGYQLNDSKKLQHFLKKILNQVDDSKYDLPGLTLQLSTVSISSMHEMGNPNFLSKKVKELEEEVIELKKKIQIVEEQEKIQNTFNKTQKERVEVEALLNSYNDWEEGKPNYEKNKTEKRKLEEDIKISQQNIDKLIEEQKDIEKEMQNTESFISRLNKTLDGLNEQKKWIERHPPDNDWQEVEVNYETITFDSLYEQYKKHYENWKKNREEISNILTRLGKDFTLIDKSQEQAFSFLKIELETISEQENSIDQRWKSIFTIFSAHCRDMVGGVDAIDTYLAGLNRLLGKQKISDLQSITIKLERNKWYNYIKKIKEWKEHDIPLFGGADQTQMEALSKAVKPLLEKVEVSVSELYDLKLIVIDSHGNKKTYDSLKLESNGTSITAKTLIFISMINEAMQGKESLGETIRLPFYIDEIDSLDDDNAENIHSSSISLGLIPIFASPKGSGICRRMYQLNNSSNGKLIVRSKDKKSGKLMLVKPTFERLSP